MNKFSAIIVLALIAVASANPLAEVDGDELESSAGFNPSNDDETAALDDRTKFFFDFCITSRDIVLGDLKTKSNSFASKAFSVLFNSAESIGLEAVDIQRDATQKLANQIRDPSGKIADYDHNNEIESIIAEGQKSIQENPSQPRSLFTGIASVLAATKNAVSSRVLSKFDEFKSLLDMGSFTTGIKEVCDRVADYEMQIQELFENAKRELASKVDQAVTVEQVQCVTSRRIIRLDGLCKFALAAYNPLIKVISYQPMPEMKQ